MEEPILNLNVNEHSEDLIDTLKLKEGIEDNSTGGQFLHNAALQVGMKHAVENIKGCEGDDEHLNLHRNFISSSTEHTLLNGQTFSHSHLEGHMYSSTSHHSNWNVPISSLAENNQSLLFSYNWYNAWMNHGYGMNSQSLPCSIQLNENHHVMDPFETNFNNLSLPLESELQKVNHFHTLDDKPSESLVLVHQDADKEDNGEKLWCDLGTSTYESKSIFTPKYLNPMRQNNDKSKESEPINSLQAECRKNNNELNNCDTFHDSLSVEKSASPMISSNSQSTSCLKTQNLVPVNNSCYAAQTLPWLGSKCDIDIPDKSVCKKIEGVTKVVESSNSMESADKNVNDNKGFSYILWHYKQALTRGCTENKNEASNSIAEENYNNLTERKTKEGNISCSCNVKNLDVSLQKQEVTDENNDLSPKQCEKCAGNRNTEDSAVHGEIANTNTVKFAIAENLSLKSTNRKMLCDNNSEIRTTKGNSVGKVSECASFNNLDVLNRKSKKETYSHKTKLKENLFTPSDKTKNRSSARKSLSKAQQAERTRNHISYLLNELPELAKCFDIHKKVGEGTFSSVFMGTLKPDVECRIPELRSRKFAIKHLIPTILPKRVARELKFLHQIGGKDNVIGVELSVRKGDCCVFVMPYLPHGKFSDYVLDMDSEETRDYIRNLMIALKRVHSFNVIHRDVKPSNFLYCRESKKYLLVDFGLSQTVTPQVKIAANERAKKRKRQEEFGSEGVKHSGGISARSMKSDSKVKVTALQQRAQEDSNILKHNVISQPLKRQRLTDSGSRSQKMIAYLQQENSSVENKRAPLTPKVSNKQNIISSQTFKLPYSSPKVLQKELSIRKKLFASNNENEVPKTCGTSKLGSPKPIISSPLTSKKVNSQSQVLTPKSVSGNADTYSPMGSTLSNESSKQKFQTLVPTPGKDGSCGQTIVRVQNSQVKSQVLKPLSPLESENQRKLLLKKQVTKKLSPSSKDAKCFCKGLPQVCSTCLKQKPIPAPRAGTPGFRPPEVLLKYPLQTTAVDMWAAGVIMLCILSGCYPFFRSPDDITALAEIMTVFGTDNIQSVARKLGRIVSTSDKRLPLDLRKLCERLRRRRKDVVAGLPDVSDSLPLCSKCENTIDSDGCLCLKEDSIEQVTGEFPLSAYDLLKKLLDLNPATRITAEEALQHPFLKGE